MTAGVTGRDTHVAREESVNTVSKSAYHGPTSRGVRALISATCNGTARAKRKSRDAAPREISTWDQVYPGTGAIRLGPSAEC